MSLQTRVVNILTRPVEAWRTIAAEPAAMEELMRGYVAPLAAIPAVCQFIAVGSLAGAILMFVFALVGAWIAAVAIERFAPAFQSRGSSVQALKLIAYSMTPVWIAGVINLVPALSVLGFIALLYAGYLLYLGLPPVMATPSERVIPFMVVSVVVMIITRFVLAAITAAILRTGASPS